MDCLDSGHGRGLLCRLSVWSGSGDRGWTGEQARDRDEVGLSIRSTPILMVPRCSSETLQSIPPLRRTTAPTLHVSGVTRSRVCSSLTAKQLLERFRHIDAAVYALR